MSFSPVVLGLCGVFLLPFSVKRARADLVFDSNTPHQAMWQQVYDAFPNAWKTRKKIVVEVVSAQAMNQLFQHALGQAPSDVVDGCYYLGGDRIDADATILLLNTLQGAQAREVFAHEYGHFVWDQLLTQQERDAYTTLWNRQRQRHCLVSRYAATSVEEGFAEAFASYVCAPQKLQAADMPSDKFLAQLKLQLEQDKQLASSSHP